MNTLPNESLKFWNFIKRRVREEEELVNHNNTVIIIEHKLDIIRYADWIIDMGPEGGKNVGSVLFEGTPEDLVNCKDSYTGKYLKNLITT